MKMNGRAAEVANKVEDLVDKGGLVSRVRVVPVFEGLEGWYVEVRAEVLMPTGWQPELGQPA